MTFTLSKDQEVAVKKLQDFLRQTQSQQFLLEGYAGTGKTYTIIKAPTCYRVCKKK